MSGRAPLISYVVGLVISDLVWRLAQPWTYIVLLLVAGGVAGVAYLMRGMNPLVDTIAFPFGGGFFAGGAIKWAVMSMFS